MTTPQTVFVKRSIEKDGNPKVKEGELVDTNLGDIKFFKSHVKNGMWKYHVHAVEYYFEELPLSELVKEEKQGGVDVEQEEFDSEIEIGELLVRSADEDGDFFIKIGKQRSTSIGTEEMKDIVKFIQYHLSQYDDSPTVKPSQDKADEVSDERYKAQWEEIHELKHEIKGIYIQLGTRDE